MLALTVDRWVAYLPRMIADLDTLLARPSRAAWRELRHHWTALGPDALRIDEWNAALSRWPDAWRVAAPAWLPIASHPRTWPARAAATPLFALARALDLVQGRALVPNEQVLAGLCALDLSHITHVRHREHRPYLAPSERILARLLRAGAYDSVTHLMVEWPTEEELVAIAALPRLRELHIPSRPIPFGPDHLAAGAFGQLLAAAPALRALSAHPDVWSSVLASPLGARLTRGVTCYTFEVESWSPSEPVTHCIESFDELTARSELVPMRASSVRRFAWTRVQFDFPPAAVDRAATHVTLGAMRKLVPKVSKEWLAQDLASLPIEVAHVRHEKGQAIPAPIRPRHLIVSRPVPAASILAPGAAPRGLEIGTRSAAVDRLWSVQEVRELLDVLTTPLEIFVLGGTTLTSSDLAGLLAHPMLRSLRVLGVDERASVKVGRKYEKRDRVPLDMGVVRALAALEELRWLSLQHFAASTPEVFDGLRLPRLHRLELDVTGATKLDHALDLIGPEMESMELSELHTIVRVPDELMHLGDHPHLENVRLIGLARLEDDAESLEYSLGGVLTPLIVSGPWLDEPV